MWWNGRFASWMCSRQICSNCVMLSCQYGPTFLRNVSNTLLNLCHKELMQFWRQKWVKKKLCKKWPGTSKVYLIKWPVIVCVWVTPNSRRFDASVRGAWFDSVEYLRSVMIMPFWLYGGFQMSDFTQNYRFSPCKFILPIMIMLYIKIWKERSYK